jgi:hypothetical protein
MTVESAPTRQAADGFAPEQGSGTELRPKVTFPSVEWFVALGQIMHEQREHFAKIGDIDCVMQLTLLDGGAAGAPWRCQVTFAGIDVADVREVGEADEERADFILETDFDTWKEMVENIIEHQGKPDLDHTLNRLSLPGVPIRLWSVDPVRRDAYYRFNQSLQHFINNAYLLKTEWNRPALS